MLHLWTLFHPLLFSFVLFSSIFLAVVDFGCLLSTARRGGSTHSVQDNALSGKLLPVMLAQLTV